VSKLVKDKQDNKMWGPLYDTIRDPLSNQISTIQWFQLKDQLYWEENMILGDQLINNLKDQLRNEND